MCEARTLGVECQHTENARPAAMARLRAWAQARGGTRASGSGHLDMLGTEVVR